MSRLLKITDNGSGILVQGTDNVLYPDNATLTYPYNSIVLVTDESDIATFRSASNNDVLFSGLIGNIEIGNEIVTKQNINTKFDAIANQESGGDVTGLFADASYDSQTKHINFYDKDNTLVAYVDATDFIKDGMVSNVEILNGNLVITFNTDAGKEPITIPLTDIFNPNNYYTKAQVDALIPTEVSELTNDAGYITQEEVIINESFPSGWHTTGTMADLITDINTDSDAVVGKAYMNTVSFSDLPSGISQAELKVDVISELQGEGKVLVFTVTSSDVSPYHWEYTSAYGASGTWRSWANSSDLANYYTKTQTDNTFATQVVVNQEIAARIQADADINTALGTKADKSDTYTKSQVDTALALKQDASTAFSGDYDDLTNKPDLSVYAESADLATVATSGSYNDLSNKPTIPSLDNYYTKTEVNTALSAKVDQSDFDTKEEVISTALNTLNTTKQDKLTAGQNITIQNNVISATGGTQQQADWNQSDSSAVDFIKNKPVIPDTSDYVSIAQYNPKELAIAEALTELNENKADKTDIPNLNNYYTKTQTDAAIQTAVGQIDLSDYVEKDDFDTKEEVISTALNSLDANKVNNLGGVVNIVKISAADYASLVTKDNNTLYIITTN